MSREFLAFDDTSKIAEGDLLSVAEQIKQYIKDQGDRLIVIFDKHTSRVTDVYLQGSAADTEAWVRAHVPDALPQPQKGRGRPKLGVVSREITLLPRQWDWLGSQPGGASVTLRRLVDAATKDPAAERRAAQDATYRFATAVAGDAPGFEEAIRALYANQSEAFADLISQWPVDVKQHTTALAATCWFEPA